MENSDVALVTGSSRGLGRAVVEHLLEKDWTVFGLSRAAQQLESKRENFVAATIDVGDPTRLEAFMRKEFKEFVESKSGLRRIAIINNAASLSPVGLSATMSAEELHRGIALNLSSPMWLAQYVLCEFPEHEVVIIDVSSGAATSPYAGWHFYCATKAGLRMSALCLAESLGQLGRQKPALIVSYAPGVMDTQMQREVREANEKDFPAVKRFRDLHAAGQLVPAERPAAEIAAFCGMPLKADRFIEERYPASSLKELNGEYT